MSTRFPPLIDMPLIDVPLIDVPVKKQKHFAKTDWKLLKSRLLDALFVGMILVSILGLAHAWLR
jgi:hypothetical protein